MPPQARLGDRSMVPADTHGCPACPHAATGPAVAGSTNVIVNGRPAIRVYDPGIHAACCGPNTWNAKTGSRSVLINGRSAHRLGDLVRHCGGIGSTIEGSSNVVVGDQSFSFGGGVSPKQPIKETEATHWFALEMLYGDNTAVLGASISVITPDGHTHACISNQINVMQIANIRNNGNAQVRIELPQKRTEEE